MNLHAYNETHLPNSTGSERRHLRVIQSDEFETIESDQSVLFLSGVEFGYSPGDVIEFHEWVSVGEAGNEPMFTGCLVIAKVEGVTEVPGKTVLKLVRLGS